MAPGGPQGRRHRGGGGRRNTRPRRSRQFLEPAILYLLCDRPQHGYALVGGLQELGIEEPVDMSTIYRLLRGLEAQGLVISTWDRESAGGPPRRVYSITEMGWACLQEMMDDLRGTARYLGELVSAYDHRVRRTRR